MIGWALLRQRRERAPDSHPDVPTPDPATAGEAPDLSWWAALLPAIGAGTLGLARFCYARFYEAFGVTVDQVGVSTLSS